MKVLGILSGRKNGNTEILMKEAFKTIEAKCGAECGFIRLQDAEIKSCVGCETCMIKKMQGDTEFRCVHPREADHFYFIEQKMREADAIIVSAPAYNLLPPGILIRFMNKLHASGDYRFMVEKENKIGATFTLGGTDWTNYALPVANMLTMELVGSYKAIVDKCHFDYITVVGAAVLEDAALERMQVLGENVADALIAKGKGKVIEYRGDPGVCPDCHGTFLEQREDGWYCPQCLTKAVITVDGKTATAHITEEARGQNRWSTPGQQLHNRNIMLGHIKGHKGRDVVTEKRKEYGALNYNIELPKL